MDVGLVPPCLELGATTEHGVLYWLTRATNEKRNLVMMSEDKLMYQAARKFRAGDDTFCCLEDAGWIEKVRIGESFRWKVLVRCFCRGDNPLAPAAGGASVTIMRAAHRGTRATWLEVGGSVDVSLPGWSVGVKSESAQKSVSPVSLLAKDFFPTVLSGDTRPQHKWEALAHNLKSWKATYGIDPTTIRLMMEEFGRHPDWCRRSNKPAWRVFLARRDELAALVATQMRRDPSNRKFGPTTKDEWFSRRTSRTYSPA